MASDFSDAASRVSDFRDELERQHERKTKAAMEDMEMSVENELRKNDSVARRVLVTDIYESSHSSEALVSREVSVPGFGKYLEHGTGARGNRDTLPDHEQYRAPSPLPPLDPILSWAIAKNVTPREYDTVYGMVEAIQQTIGEEGTFPHPFMRPVWYSQSRGYRHVINENWQAIRTALRRF